MSTPYAHINEQAPRRGEPRPAEQGSQQAFAEEAYDAVEGGFGGVALFVDQVEGDDGVGGAREVVGIAGGGVELDGLEAIAELGAQALEALGRAEAVAGEAEAEHG